MSKRTLTYLAIAVLGVAFVLTLFESSSTAGSSYSTKPDGVRALFELMDEYSDGVEAWRYPATRLSSDEDDLSILVIVSPPKLGGVKPLKEWVEAGNTLAYFPQAAGRDDPIFELFNVTTEPRGINGADDIVRAFSTTSSPFTCPSTAQSEICQGVRQLTDGSVQTFTLTSRFSSVRGRPSAPTGVFSHVGKGSVWLFADASLISNQFIDTQDNLRFLYQLLSTHDRILFDEFHHGFVAPAAGSSEERVTSLFVVGGYLLLLLVVWVLSRAKRFGPSMPDREEPPAMSAEFATALGLLYAERGTTTVLSYYVASWARRVAQELRVPASLPVNELIELLAIRGVISAVTARGCHAAVQTLESKQALDEDTRASAVRVLEEALPPGEVQSSALRRDEANMDQ